MSDVIASSAQLQTAVLLLVFNRPETTKKVFEAIKRVKPTRLYIAADGPREHYDGEVQRIGLVRKITTEVDWPCEVKTLFRDRNLGCKGAVVGGINWFFENEEQGIILEDDCLPSNEFFQYCEYYLNNPGNQKNIYSVSGTRFGKSKSPCLARYSLMWGWATWSEKWKQYISDFDNYEETCRNKFSSISTRHYWMRVFERTKSNRINTWDYQWIYTIIKNNGLVIRPPFNLVNNIGFMNDSTHYADPLIAGIMNESSDGKLNLVEKLNHNLAVDKEDETVWLGLNKYKRLKIIIRLLFERIKLSRRIIDSTTKY